LEARAAGASGECGARAEPSECVGGGGFRQLSDWKQGGTGPVKILEAKGNKLSSMRSGSDMRKPALNGAFFWLSAFYVVYCARPEDWIPGLGYIPLAKITAVLAFLGLLSSLGKTQRKLWNLPQEGGYLLALMCVLFLSACLSPIWKGGAVSRTLDFAKVYVVWLLTYLLLTNFARLRRMIFIQAASVSVISTVSIIIGRSKPRLEGAIGGIYSNPNDLAFAIVLTLPFCLAFLLTAKRIFVKLCWTAAILIMGLTLFMTASRAGIITLMISGTVCLWHFGVKGRRFYLIVASALAVVLLLAVAGGPLIDRMVAIGGRTDTQEEARAYGSYEQRRYLMAKALEGIAHYPVLGLGVRNFPIYSGAWRDVHMTYLQIAVEGGIPALILYLLFFARGFSNLRKMLRRRDLDVQTTLIVGALHSSMVGFAVGALFAPEAYQFFPYFSVAYTSALLAIITERELATELPLGRPGARLQPEDTRANYGKPDARTLVY
jgi:O-antigen ligase